jgi:hydroxylamine reductase (hybrid-cluster protein)
MKLEERLKAQMPQNELASAGMLCTYCDLGPCAINPFDDEPQVGACGIDAENMNYLNLGLKVIKGLHDYGIAGDVPLDLGKMLGYSHAAGVTIEDLVKASNPLLQASEQKVAEWQSEQRKPREIEHGIGVLEKDAVNIVITLNSPEMMKTARSQKMRNLARDKDATGINLVGALCGGAEVSYNYGIPLLGCTHEVEEAADMIDYVYDGGDPTEACEKAVENFSHRDKAAFRRFTPTRFTFGYDIKTDAINEAVKKGIVNGVVVIMGCKSGKSTWNMDDLVQELIDKKYMVINLSCSLRGEPEPEECEMMMEYKIPCVLNAGCCEPGKVKGLDLNNVTVVIPGWRDPRTLTAAFAFASEGVPVIVGTVPFVVPQVLNNLSAAGIKVESDSSKIADLVR